MSDVICEREKNRAPTIVTTNLSLTKIGERYGERIASRLVGWCDIYQFSGPDLRQMRGVAA